MSSAIVVKKFGGAGLSTPEKVKAVANHLKDCHRSGQKVIAVVSAMGSTTDELIKKAYEISPNPDKRELDMLISTGERVSMSLLTMALKDLGCDAISFTGSQAGVLTDGTHSTAKIIEVKPIRVKEAIDKNQIVVIAGFQGVDPNTKEITTLGRGGTDTSAVAMAGFFKTAECEIVKEVPGICTADPNLVKNAKVIQSISFESMLHMCQWGAKALHKPCVEMAAKLNVPLKVRSLGSTSHGTLVSSQGSATGLNLLGDLFCLSGEDTFETLTTHFESKNWQLPELIHKDSNIAWYRANSQLLQCVRNNLPEQIRLVKTNCQALTITGNTGGSVLPQGLMTINSEFGTTVILQNPLSSKEIEGIHEKLFR